MYKLSHKKIEEYIDEGSSGFVSQEYIKKSLEEEKQKKKKPKLIPVNINILKQEALLLEIMAERLGVSRNRVIAEILEYEIHLILNKLDVYDSVQLIEAADKKLKEMGVSDDYWTRQTSVPLKYTQKYQYEYAHNPNSPGYIGSK